MNVALEKLPKTVHCGDYYYTFFKPTIFKPYKVWFQKMYVTRYLRLLLQSIRGELIVYMHDKNDEICGYIHLEQGNKRYPWSTKSDLIISPYAIKESKRGRGLGNKIIYDFQHYIAQYIYIYI